MSALSSLIGSPAAATTPASTSSAASADNSSLLLSQNDFMQLMIAQMKNQDPTSPTSTTDFVTQIAQFSDVEGMTQLNTSIGSLVSMQSLSQGVSLIGTAVTYSDAAGKTASGTVDSVAMVSGQPHLVINDTQVPLSQIQDVQA